MLQHLLESHPTERRWAKVAPAASASVVVHALVLSWGLLLYNSAEAVTVERSREVPRAQFVGIAPVEERRPGQPPPPPVHPVPLNPSGGGGGGRVAAPKYLPKTGADPIAGDRPLGFQELAIPEPAKGIPLIDSLARVAVRAEDFTGRGVIGGVAGGKKPDGPVAEKASEVIRADSVGFGPGTGGRGRGGTGGGTSEGGEPWFYADDLEEPPRLANADELARLLPRLYPQALRSAGMGGRVEVEFVVDTSGRVRMETVQIVASVHELLSEATRKAMPQLRYVPGRIRYRGRSAKVQVRVRTAIDWALIEPGT